MVGDCGGGGVASPTQEVGGAIVLGCGGKAPMSLFVLDAVEACAVIVWTSVGQSNFH